MYTYFPSVLSDKVEELGEELKSHFSIEEFSSVSVPTQVFSCPSSFDVFQSDRSCHFLLLLFSL